MGEAGMLRLRDSLIFLPLGRAHSHCHPWLLTRAPPLRPSAPPFQLPCACLKHKGKSTAVPLPAPASPAKCPLNCSGQKRRPERVNVEVVPGPSGGARAHRALRPPRPGSAQGGWSRARNSAPGPAGAAEGGCCLASLHPLRARATRGPSASSSPEASGGALLE